MALDPLNSSSLEQLALKGLSEVMSIDGGQRNNVIATCGECCCVGYAVWCVLRSYASFASQSGIAHNRAIHTPLSLSACDWVRRAATCSRKHRRWSLTSLAGAWSHSKTSMCVVVNCRCWNRKKTLEHLQSGQSAYETTTRWRCDVCRWFQSELNSYCFCCYCCWRAVKMSRSFIIVIIIIIGALTTSSVIG